jgi:hypothetical protein
MQFCTDRVSIVQDLGSRRLRAYYDHAFLWSKAPTDPGCADEVVEFYVLTLIRFLEVLETSSAHVRMELLARSRCCDDPRADVRRGGFLGEYHEVP